MSMSSFDACIRAFTDLKAFEGMAVVTDSDPDDLSPTCRISDLLARVRPRQSPVVNLGDPGCDDATDAIVSAPTCNAAAPAVKRSGANLSRRGLREC